MTAFVNMPHDLYMYTKKHIHFRSGYPCCFIRSFAIHIHKVNEGSDEELDLYPNWVATHACLKSNLICICVKCHFRLNTRFPTMWYFDKCRLRRSCAASYWAKKLQMLFGQQLNSYQIFKYLAKALIRLRVCAG